MTFSSHPLLVVVSLIVICSLAGCVAPRTDVLATIRSEYASGELDLATAQCGELLRRNPRDADAECWLGNIAAARGNHRQALQHYERYSVLSPRNFHPHNRIGWAHFNLKEFPESIQAFENANAIQPDYGAFLGIGRCRIEQDQLSEALAALLQAEKLKPNEEVLHALATVYERMAHYDKALAVLRRVNTSASKFRQSKILVKIGQVNTAASLLSQLLDEKTAVASNRALTAKARRSLEKEIGNIRTELAFCRLRAGQRAEAAQLLQGRPVFGFEMQTTDQGALRVNDVIPQSPAFAAGLMKGDVIKDIDSVVITNGRSQFFEEVFPHLRFGQSSTFGIARDGNRIALEISAGITPNPLTAPDRGGPQPIDLPKRHGPRVIIAVANLDAVGVSVEEAHTLSENLRDAFVNTGYFRVVSRADMQRILKEVEFQNTDGCSGAECLVEMGRLLAVQKMVGGSIGRVGEIYNVTVRMIDIETSGIDCSVAEDLDLRGEVGNLLPAVRNVARELALKYARGRTKP